MPLGLLSKVSRSMRDVAETATHMKGEYAPPAPQSFAQKPDKLPL
jgi:hypothetical protein